MKTIKTIIGSIILLTAASTTTAHAGRFIEFDELNFGETFSLKTVYSGKWLYMDSEGNLKTGQSRSKAETFTMLDSAGELTYKTTYGMWGFLANKVDGEYVAVSPKGSGDELEIVDADDRSNDDLVTFVERPNEGGVALKFKDNLRYLGVKNDNRWQTVKTNGTTTSKTNVLIYSWDR